MKTFLIITGITLTILLVIGFVTGYLINKCFEDEDEDVDANNNHK
jgi:hypothetical protein